MTHLAPERAADPLASPPAATATGLPALDPATPVLLLGGAGNAVSVARNFGELGIAVSISGGDDGWGMASRHCTRAYPVPEGREKSDYWRELLLPETAPDSGQPPLAGHVLMALCDSSIAFLCDHREALARHYLVEDFDPDLRRDMLDKRATLEHARAGGVPVPEYWSIDSLADLDAIRDRLSYPVMVKPIHSHLFIPVMGRKLFIIDQGFDQLRDAVARAFAHGLEVMVVEMIPGPDDLLTSYYTYVDRGGQSLFHYTKSVIRRFPVTRGGGCYHRSHWQPETARMGQRFFASMPWRGMGNIEFKRDPRDGKLKVIEVNPRFTAAHRLVTAAGLPIDQLIYRSLTGQPVPVIRQPADDDLRMWNPIRDFLAFLELRRRGQLTFRAWLASVAEGRKVMPLFSFGDPRPTLWRMRQEAARALARLRRG